MIREVQTRDLHEKGKKGQHPEISNLKQFEQIELPAKLREYILWSNKSNIDQDDWS